MPQYLVAIQHPDNYQPPPDAEAMMRDISALNREMIAAGVRDFAGGLQPAGKAKSVRQQAAGEVVVTDGRYRGEGVCRRSMAAAVCRHERGRGVGAQGRRGVQGARRGERVPGHAGGTEGFSTNRTDEEGNMRLMTSAVLLAIGMAHQGMAQDSATKYTKMAPVDQYLMADRGAEIALARTAAPASISRDAEVLVLGRHGFESAVRGKNGFVCFVGRGWLSAPDADF